MYIDTIVKRFGMENSKRDFIPIRHGVQISKEHSPKTPEDRAFMERIPYASRLGPSCTLCYVQDQMWHLL